MLGRTLGVDFGSKRIGLAISDSMGVLASPIGLIERTGSRDADHRKIAAVATEEEAVRIVVGLPRNLDGKTGIAATAILEEIDVLKKNIPDMSIETWDERLTTAAAHTALRDRGISTKKRKGIIDAIAAANILQGWLDAHDGQPTKRDEQVKRP